MTTTVDNPESDRGSDNRSDAARQDGPADNPQLMAMRREFDLSFSQSATRRSIVSENYLGLRFGEDAYAIRVAAIAGLHVDRRIMPLLSPVPSLLGVVGFRGVIAPVFDLAALLGYGRNRSDAGPGNGDRIGAPRWIVLVRSIEPVALAFDNFEAHFSVTGHDILSAQQLLANRSVLVPDGARAHLCDAVRVEGVIRPIIELQSLLRSVLNQQPESLSKSQHEFQQSLNPSRRHRSKSS
jgi:chemotaxis signal transduction protein